jgi:hypothetical protein
MVKFEAGYYCVFALVMLVGYLLKYNKARGKGQSCSRLLPFTRHREAGLLEQGTAQ